MSADTGRGATPVTPPGNPEPSPFVVGVDGGGSGCRALVLKLDGKERARAEGPPALVDPSEPGRATSAIAATVREAAARAGILLPARALWAGLAGAGRAGEREAVEIGLRSLDLAHTVRVGTDVEGAHRDAFGGGPGVLLVVGTGSMAWGRDPEGREVRVGGWGSLLGDEGSGYWLGLGGLRGIARAADGRGPATVLTDRLLDALGLPGPQALIPWAASASKAQVAALAPRVLAAAFDGDPVGVELLKGGLEALLRHLEVVRAKWPAHGEAIPMALAGGLAEGIPPFRERLETLVAGVGGRLAPPPVVPVRGAAKLALDLCVPPLP